jgi:hypothetical protein
MAKKGITRLTRPEYGYPKGIGIVPRRGWDAMTARLIGEAERTPVTGLQNFYRRAPLQLLDLLFTIHSMAKMALSNDKSLSFAPPDISLTAVETITRIGTNGKPEVVEETDSVATDLLKTFWEGYPGGLPAFQRSLTRQASAKGLLCAECIPGNPLEGVAKVVIWEPLSADYVDTEEGRKLKQWGNTEDLDPETVLACAIDGDEDNPYGEPLASAFLSEGLKDLAQEMNLSDILRGWAYPHELFYFPFTETVQYAKDNPDILKGAGPGGENLTPYEFAQQEFDNFCTLLETVNPDDPIVVPKGGDGKVLEGGAGLDALEPILKMRRHRMVMGLDQFPAMLGITDGGTQAYTQHQMRTQAQKYSFLRFAVNYAVVWASNLHLRLLGLNRTAKVEEAPILPADRKAEAEAEQIEVETTIQKVDRGWITEEDASVKHTGSAPVGRPKDDTDPEDDADPNDPEREDQNNNDTNRQKQ